MDVQRRLNEFPGGWAPEHRTALLFVEFLLASLQQAFVARIAMTPTPTPEDHQFDAAFLATWLSRRLELARKEMPETCAVSHQSRNCYNAVISAREEYERDMRELHLGPVGAGKWPVNTKC